MKENIDCNKFSFSNILIHCHNGKPYYGYTVQYVEDIPTRWDILNGKYDDEFIAC